MQNSERRWFSLVSFHSMEWICESGKWLYLQPRQILNRSQRNEVNMEMLDATSASLFRLWPWTYSKHTHILLPYDVGALCYCISNLQRGSRKQLLLKKLQLTTRSLLSQSGVKKHALFTMTKKNTWKLPELLVILVEKALLFCCTPHLLTLDLRRVTWSHSVSFTVQTCSESKAASEFNIHFLPVQLISIWFVF